MPPSIARLLRSVRKPLPSTPNTPSSNRLAGLDGLRSAMLQAVDDCTGLPAQRLQIKIRNAHTHRDLWMLRSDAYRLIALHHCQSIADQRIHPLLNRFEGWMAPQEINRVT
jgi:hypothetical protein